MYYNVESIDLDCAYEVKEVKEFLSNFNLEYSDVDYTIVIREDSKIIATCSKKGKIVKCFAIDENYQGLGISNSLISHITSKLFEEKIYHNFIFTKPENTYLFKGLGYKLIIETDKVSLLETGNKDIGSSLDNLIKKYDIDTSKEYASIVMNCNPFTIGHRYLIEKVSSENENVIIFLVEEDKSIFPFKHRLEIVREGTKDLKNVEVIESSEYVISSATFPNYFLKQNDDTLKEYTKVDCNIFGKYFCEKFNIKTRYVGSEPCCLVTNTYNDSLKEILPNYDVKVNIIERVKNDDRVISASRVRDLLLKNKIEEVKNLVPKVTFNFLLSEEGVKIQNGIKQNR